MKQKSLLERTYNSVWYGILYWVRVMLGIVGQMGEGRVRVGVQELSGRNQISEYQIITSPKKKNIVNFRTKQEKFFKINFWRVRSV